MRFDGSPRSGFLLLNVDDREPSRYARTAILRRAGYIVIEASSGGEAVAVAAERRPALVVLDVMLPDYDGLEVCRRLKADRSTAPLVLLVSAMAIDSQHRVRGLDSGADGYLLMPAEPAELLAQVRALLRLREAEDVLRESEHRIALAEAAVRETAELRRVALEIAQLGTWEFDVAKGLTRVDARASEIFGVNPGEALTTEAVLALVHPDDRERVRGEVAASIDAGIYESEYRVVRTDGIRHVAVRGRLTRVAQAGETRDGFVGTVMDVTDQKRTEAAVRHQTDLLSAIIDNIPVLLVIWDPALERFRFNKHLREVLGWSESDAADGRFLERAYPDPAYRREVAEYMRSLAPGWRDLKTTARDGTAVDISWANVQIEGGASIGIGVDIRDRKAVEAAMTDLNERLADADRRKDEFIALLAHELRNPLAPVRTAVGILRARGPADPILIKCRDVIDRQVTHMARLLDDLLDVSRLVRGNLILQRAPVLLNEIIDAALEISRPLIEQHGHTIAVEGLESPMVLEADAARLTQVFGNLLNNAAKYSEPGGRIYVRVSHQDGHVRVAIRDEGIGIAPAMLDRIFELFTQVDATHTRSHGGLGIGLSLARRLVEMHQGTITASSAGPGQGSEFVVSLPVVPVDEAAAAPSAFVTAPPATLSRRVLVADDNADAVEMIATLLGDIGCVVRTAYDGQTAVREAERFRPELVLLDIGMPGLNGYEACEHIRRQPWSTGTTIVAVTGWGQDQDMRRTASAGFDRHLVKPVNPETLIQLVRDLRAGF